MSLINYAFCTICNTNSICFSACLSTVMKSLNSSQDSWQVERINTELKIHKLQEELERVTLENNRLLERSAVSETGKKEFQRTGYRGGLR